MYTLNKNKLPNNAPLFSMPFRLPVASCQTNYVYKSTNYFHKKCQVIYVFRIYMSGGFSQFNIFLCNVTPFVLNQFFIASKSAAPKRCFLPTVIYTLQFITFAVLTLCVQVESTLQTRKHSIYHNLTPCALSMHIECSFIASISLQVFYEVYSLEICQRRKASSCRGSLFFCIHRIQFNFDCLFACVGLHFSTQSSSFILFSFF